MSKVFGEPFHKLYGDLNEFLEETQMRQQGIDPFAMPLLTSEQRKQQALATLHKLPKCLKRKGGKVVLKDEQT